MNKALSFTLFIAISIISCKKENGGTDCNQLSQQSDWSTIDFKTNYSIQFPNDYSGQGKVGFEGNIFNKNRNDNSVVFSYAYCSPLFCEDFGGNLADPAPNSIDTKTGITLDQKATFCENGSQEAILYYNHSDNANGILYWKESGTYKQAAEISFKHSRLQEVLDIVKTITKK